MSEPCVASPRRLRWAMLRTGWPAEKCGIWTCMPLSMDTARILAVAADIPIAALYLPDPSRWEMLRAMWYGLRR